MFRIRRLLAPQPSDVSWTPLLAAGILIATALTLGAWQNAGSPPSRAVAAETWNAEAPSLPWTYRAWLEQDVVYIIADDERAAFLRLTAEAELSHFVEQFWLRRDPTPGTPANEAKEEHYRRIAYANARFATASGLNGWRTDRGHMYIVYGPPDEIESHQAGMKGPYAREVWLYRHIDGAGDRVTVTFLDRGGNGDFRLTPSNVR